MENTGTSFIRVAVTAPMGYDIKMQSSISIKEKIRDNAFWICVLTFAVMSAGELLSLLTDLFPFPFFGSGFRYTFNIYISFWGIWAAFAVFLLLNKRDREIIDSIRPSRPGNTAGMLLLGLAAGVLMNGACAAAAYMHGDIRLIFVKCEPAALVLMLAAVFVQSSAEEFVCRGFLYRRLERKYSGITALLVSSAFFAAMHLGNDGISVLGIADLFVTGIFFGLLVYCFNSLWMAMTCHAAWNYTQNIILGLPNSGEMSRYSVFMLREQAARSSFAYDKMFGLEGTAMSVAVMAAGCAAVLLVYRTKKHA